MRRKSIMQVLLRLIMSLVFAMVMPTMEPPTMEPPVLAPVGKRRVALCYVRQSYTRTGEDTASPDRQRANIEAMLAGSGLILEWYEDVRGHMSGSSVDNRPKWLELESRLDDEDVALVIANDLARFHRRGWRIGEMVNHIQKNNVRLLLAAPGRQIDLSTWWGQFMVFVMGMCDEYYVIDARMRQADNARRRREKGLTTGIPPFATYRGDGGYLELTRRGAWFLPDAHFVAGVPEECPQEGAIWRPYATTALKILTAYANTPAGYEKIASDLQTEGWPFEDQRDVPRRIMGEDVRRVLANWPEYGGLVVGQQAKMRKLDQLNQIIEMDFIEERAIFPIDILQQVGLRQRATKEKYVQTNHGVIHAAFPYALRNLLRCAACEEAARLQNDPRLRSRLGGTNQNSILRYRHKRGFRCGCPVHSVRCEVVEAEFVQLLTSLRPRKGIMDSLLKIGAQVSQRFTFKPVNFAQQKQQTLQRIARQIAALHHEHLAGKLPVDDYTHQLAQREREQEEWLARPIPPSTPPFDLATCVAMLDHLDILWQQSTPEYRQLMAQNLFEYLVYDLEKQCIVDFRLTPWARFLLRKSGSHSPQSPS